jgi:hypothetical protein
VPWSISVNEEVECLKKNVAIFGICSTQAVTDVLTAKMPHNDDPTVYLKWVVTRIRFMGIKLKKSVTLVQNFCARFCIKYTSVLLSL